MSDGKMTRVTPPVVGKIEKVELPAPISKMHKNVELHVDFFFVNKVAFLHTKSAKINFLTAQYCRNRTKESITDAILKVIKIYTSRGFIVTAVHGDGEFNIKMLKEEIFPAKLVIYAKNQHVPIAERSIRTIKERCRCACHAVPYTKYTKLMVRSLIESRVIWLNRFPSKNGLSTSLSPATIVTGEPKPDMSKSRIPFGSYAMVYISTSNDMIARSVPAIALVESNDLGGYYFMSLYSGKKIHAYEWNELPINDEVIAQVESLAAKEKQPKIIDKAPLFEWNTGVEIDDQPVEDFDETEINENDEEVIINEQQENIDVVEQGEDVEIEERDVPDNMVTDDETDDDKVDEDEDLVFENDRLEPINEVESDSEDEESDVDNENVISEEEEIVEDSDSDNEGNTSREAVYETNEGVEIEIEDSDDVSETVTEGRPRRANAGGGVDRYEPSFEEKTYEVRRRFQYFQFKRKKKRAQFLQIRRETKKLEKVIMHPTIYRRLYKWCLRN